jgi:hypothetical protein
MASTHASSSGGSGPSATAASAAADVDRLAVEDGRQRGEALLPIKEELATEESGRVLFDGEVPRRDTLVRLPHQDRAARVSTIQGIEQIPDPRRLPDILALNLGETEFPALVHVDQGADGDVLLLHRRQARDGNSGTARLDAGRIIVSAL